MANRNTKRAKKLLSKQIAAEHAAGRKVVNPPSKRKSKWRGAHPRKTTNQKYEENVANETKS